MTDRYPPTGAVWVQGPPHEYSLYPNSGTTSKSLAQAWLTPPPTPATDLSTFSLIRRCYSCKRYKSIEKFVRRPESKHGRCYQCHACKSARQYANIKADPIRFARRKAMKSRKMGVVAKKFLHVRREAERRAIPFSLRIVELREWLLTVEQKCFYCDIPREKVLLDKFSKGHLTIDRKDTHDGYRIDNITLSCWMCNRSKSNLFTAEEFKEIAQKYIKPKWQQRVPPYDPLSHDIT